MVTQKQKQVLSKYKIDSDSFETKRNLLIEIDSIMTDFVDEFDEPLEEFLELEKLYDEIYMQN